MKFVLFLCLNMIFTVSWAQITVSNSSFEGTRGAALTPPSWQACSGTTPDTQPGFFGVTLPPSDGNSYLGLGSSAGLNYYEAVYQVLSSPLIAGKKYKFSIDIAQATPTGGIIVFGDIYLQVYGGNNPCDSALILWNSNFITNLNWQTFEIEISPNINCSYLLFKARGVTGHVPYILLDNMKEIKETIFPKVTITSPDEDSDNKCSFKISGKTDSIPTQITLSGKFNSSPVNAIILTDSTWEAALNYLYGYNGKDTIIASATFQNSIAYDTLIVNVSCQPPTIEIVTPTENALQICSFTVSGTIDSIPSQILLTGSFVGSPVNPVLLTDSTWEMNISYSYGFMNDDTLIVQAIFPSYVSKDSLKVKVNCANINEPVLIPNLITSNGDGQNDAFYIKNLPDNSRIVILNRWGDTIYKSDNYLNNWTTDLDGVYFYKILIKEVEYKGWVEVIH